MADTSTKIFLSGVKYEGSASQTPSSLGSLSALQGAIEMAPVGGANMSAARSAGQPTAPIALDVSEDDLVEITLENGLRIWQTVEQAQKDYATASRDPSQPALLIPSRLPLRDENRAASRGLGDYIVRNVSIIKAKLMGKAAEYTGAQAALYLAQKIESSLDLGLHRCTRATDPGAEGFTLTPAAGAAIPDDKPILVLLHGTFSSTEGSFGELLREPGPVQGQPLWDRLEKAFEGGIFALEHRSVTESPIENAIALVRALPKGARVSMMSHSRGGLIAELMARASRIEDSGDDKGPFDGDDYKILRKTGKHEKHVKDLQTLRRLMRERELTIERIVRVAGPIGGTTLASERLDRFMSVALNAFDLIPALRASIAYDLFQSFMVGLLRSKANPDDLPGLEAMHPLGPVVQLLNRADVRLSSRLSVIAGDNEGTGVLRKLAEMAADFFFEDENDFVVNYKSMLRGMPRAVSPNMHRIDSENITHFTYFSNLDARMNIAAALVYEPAPVAMAEALQTLRHAETARAPEIEGLAARGDGNQPVCFVLPGVMGSHIYQDDKWVWVNPFRLATGGVKRLKLEADDVEPGPMLNRFYGDLARHIGRTHKSIPFSYDWRMSITDAAERLSKLVKQELENTDQPIRFMAHSMGGLVVRAFQHNHKSLWAQVKSRPGSRFVMLGTPNGGAFSMMNNMLGRTKQLKMIAAADPTHNLKEILDIITDLPGLMQLLPSDSDEAYLQRSLWTQLHSHDGEGWVVPPEEAFEAARAGHKLLREHQLDPETTCYVAGLGEDATPSLVRLVPGDQGGKEIEVRGTFKGDGTVTWATGIPDGIQHWYMPAIHGDMARHKPAFPALVELLETGQTNALSKTPPALARGDLPDDVTIRAPRIETYPSQDELESAVMGGRVGIPDAPAPAAPNLHISIAHGDLRYARYPVAVGHYQDDPISGAEAALDSCLDNHLTRVRDLGLYPGRIDTCEVFLRRGRAPEGAIVIGLGKFGDLTPGDLRITFRQAVLRYAMTLRRDAEQCGKSVGEMEPIGLSTLLIGNRNAKISIQQSIESLIEAVVDANKLLGETPIANLEFVELFDDTAFGAAEALERISRNGRVKNGFTHTSEIQTLMGARLRASFGGYSDAWQRMRVTKSVDHAETLHFEAIGDDAIVLEENARLQPAVMAELTGRSKKDTALDRELGRMLFELMVPGPLKNFAKDDQKLLLIVDKDTAAYPWELLEDDFSVFETDAAGGPDKDQIKPLVVRTPVIRQLVSGATRAPRAVSDTALVIGDPKSEWPDLPGAQAEAKMVAEFAEEELKYKVTCLNPPDDGIQALRKIIRQPTKMLHLAGHGDLGSPDSGKMPGMILGGGLRLTEYEIRQMRYVPELVFLNCCHLGHIASDVGTIAANLAEVFIQQGARAVVAAGWAVDDRAALCFAREFYSSLSNGNTFGDAVHHARIEVYTRHGDTNTWGAYQCYGDQDYKLESKSGTRPGGGVVKQYFSPAHATKAAINIAHDAATATTGRAKLISALNQIEDTADDGWYEDVGWCEAMGTAFSRLDVFDRAIDLLEMAVTHPGGGASINTVEQLQNLKLREAVWQWEQARRKLEMGGAALNETMRRDLQDKIDEAAQNVIRTSEHTIKVLERLDKLSVDPSADDSESILTAEREGLKGAAYKRRVIVEDARLRPTYLKAMTASYESGMDLVLARNPDTLDTYTTSNWLTGIVVSGKTTARGAALDVWFARLVQQGRAQEKKNPNFWNAIVEPEVDIMRPLCGPRKDPIKDINTNALFEKVTTEIGFAWDRGGSYRQARSMREQVHFLKCMMEGAHVEKQEWIARIEAFLTDLTWDYRDM